MKEREDKALVKKPNKKHAFPTQVI